jgi:hypothetical protein
VAKALIQRLERTARVGFVEPTRESAMWTILRRRIGQLTLLRALDDSERARGEFRSFPGISLLICSGFTSNRIK